MGCMGMIPISLLKMSDYVSSAGSKRRRYNRPYNTQSETPAYYGPRNSDEAIAKNRKRGMAISMKMNSKYPYHEYGRSYTKRGSDENLAYFGPSYKEANDEQKGNRRNYGYIGRGKYSFGKFAKGVGQAFRTGRQIINTGSKIAKVVGSGLYTGRGLYSGNNLIEGARPSMQFSSPNDETQSLILSHCEYIGDIFGPESAAFSNTKYELNPGLIQNFPFLAQFAVNFEEYEFIQLLFEFHSTVDSSSTSNTAGNTGTIIMATNYRSDAALFVNKEEMIQYHGGVSGRLTEALVHGVECDPSKVAFSNKFVRNKPIFGSDIKTYDHGIFQLAIQNTPTPFINQQVGELWVTYSVKLSKPKLFSSLQLAETEYRKLSHGSNVTLLNTWGDQPLYGAANNFLPKVSSIYDYGGNGRMKVTMPADASGVFSIELHMEGTGMPYTDHNPAISYFGNCTPFRDIYGVFYPNQTTAPNQTLCPGDAAMTGHSAHRSLTVHFRTQAATGGVDNAVTFRPFGNLTHEAATTGTLKQCYIVIKEIGSMFSISEKLSYPRWVTEQGAIVEPHPVPLVTDPDIN